MRRRGVGSVLLGAAIHIAARNGARTLRVETQQINVAACRLYAHHGFRLQRLTHGAYADVPGETQLLWIRELDQRPAPAD